MHCWKYGGLKVSTLISGLSSLGSNPGYGQIVLSFFIFLLFIPPIPYVRGQETVLSHCPPQPMCIQWIQYWVWPCDGPVSHPGSSRNSDFMPQKPRSTTCTAWWSKWFIYRLSLTLPQGKLRNILTISASYLSKGYLIILVPFLSVLSAWFGFPNKTLWRPSQCLLCHHALTTSWCTLVLGLKIKQNILILTQ